MDNANSPEYLDKIKTQVIENIRRTAHAPSVQMTDIPPDISGMDEDAEREADDADEDNHKDERYTQRRWDKHIEADGELSDGDEFGNAAAMQNGVRPQEGARRRMNIMDYRNENAVPDDEEVVAQHHTAEAINSVEKTNGEVPAAAAPQTESSSGPNLETVVSAANDVEMTDGDDVGNDRVQATQGITPPASPRPVVASTAITSAMDQPKADEDQVMADEVAEATSDAAKVEGVEEREAQNATAERTTELAKESADAK